MSYVLIYVWRNDLITEDGYTNYSTAKLRKEEIEKERKVKVVIKNRQD